MTGLLAAAILALCVLLAHPAWYLGCYLRHVLSATERAEASGE